MLGRDSEGFSYVVRSHGYGSQTLASFKHLNQSLAKRELREALELEECTILNFSFVSAVKKRSQGIVAKSVM